MTRKLIRCLKLVYGERNYGKKRVEKTERTSVKIASYRKLSWFITNYRGLWS